ncbi:transmembrane amino acid transporter protein-domain-containing protein [Suillus discolor]|uniref:Transmembrane amino acid transporter protein-domain-containing protein n=1 Tax=Suillus discolor TaxID=1912936 RepID=A0A9P7EYW4_9AGAM|nr:transmembrane amino acid transporter protein-domain-containing protein [Suillus discolor]KAG2098437.1 transmembrane amino acid transporter protein-domain-containing protein [Suillus discolor]
MASHPTYEAHGQPYVDETTSMTAEKQDSKGTRDVFGEDGSHQIQYKTLSWQAVSLLMIAEIVSNGILSLPSALAVVGIVPAVILIVFLGIFGLYTAKLLIDFKLNHPNVHTMGDAGYIMFGPVAREVLAFGTVSFAVFGSGSGLLSSQQALSTLSNQGMCSMYLVLITGAVAFLISLPRTLDRLAWMGLVSAAVIAIAGFIAMIGAGVNPVPGRTLTVAASSNFFDAFLAVTNPVGFCICRYGILFFILISEMRKPEEAIKAAWCLQGFATIFYVVFSVVMYVYIGNTVQSPVLFSLPPVWAKAAFAIALPNFLFSSGLYTHTATKLVFVRIFRHSEHVHSHTLLGWTVWTLLCLAGSALAAILAIAVPIFSYLIGIAAALFAAWYTYGLAGFFWLHDAYHLEGGMDGLKRRPIGTTLAVLTILSGTFICVAGTYVSIKLIVEAYADGQVGRPFVC